MDYLWFKGKNPKHFNDKECEAIRKLFLEQTNEKYAIATIRTMPIPEWNGNIILAEKDEQKPQEKLRGLLWCSPFKDDIVRVVAFALDQELQGNGYGSKAWEIFVDAAKNAGFNYVQLEVRAKNTRAQNFYKKRGLEIIQRLEGYYANDLGYCMKGKI